MMKEQEMCRLFNIVGIAFLIALSLLAMAGVSYAAAPSFRFTVNMNEAVTVDTTGGTPSLPIDVGGQTRAAVYTAGSGTAALTFTYTATPGDVDLDGIAVSSPIALNSGSIADLAGNPIAPADLAFAPPVTTGVKVSYPSLSMDFVNDKYMFNGTVYNSFGTFKTASSAVFTNDTNGTYFDSTGTMLKTTAINTPRLDYDPVTLAAKGLLLEEQRTNYVRDSEFSGLSVASYGSNTTVGQWEFILNGGGSLSVVSKGTVNGMNYVDLRFQRNNSSGITQFLNFRGLTGNRASVTSGQSTILSAWLGVTSYSSTGGTCQLILSNRSMTAGGAYISEQQLIRTSTTAFGPAQTPVLTHGATAGLAEGFMYVTVPDGVNCDITVRYAAPQFEIGKFKTSYIPTTGASSVTRARDIFRIPTAASWYDQAASTVYTDFSYLTSSGTAFPILLRFDDGTSTNRWGTFYNQGTGTIGMDGYTGNVFQGGFAVTLPVSSSLKWATAQAANNVNTSYNGNIAGNDTNYAVPTITQLTLSESNGGITKWIKTYSYYPSRAANAQLQLLTQ